MSTGRILSCMFVLLMATLSLGDGNLQSSQEYTVRANHGEEVWTEMSVTSETPFLIVESRQTIFAHPAADAVASLSYRDFGSLDPEHWRLDSVDFSPGGQNPADIRMGGTLRSILYYSYHGYAGWYNYALESTITIKEPVLKLETTASDGSTVTLYREPISIATPYIDYLNCSYHFNLGMGVGEDRLFSDGLPVHMKLVGYSDSTELLLYDGGWATTDANGNVTFGSGGNDVYIHCTGPTDYIQLEVTPIDPQTSMTSYSYLAYEGKLEGDYRFFEGTLLVAVKDVCGNPVQARVHVSGGPVWGTSPIERFTDAAGHAEFVYGSDSGGFATAPVKILPVLNLDMGLTQIIDGPSGILASRPLFINGSVKLTNGAYSFGTSYEIRDLTIKLFKDEAEVDSNTSFTIQPSYTDVDRRRGRDRYKFTVQPTPTPARYWVKAYMKDTDGEDALVGSLYRDVQATVKPTGDRTLHFQYVPIEPEKSSGDTAWLEDCVKRVLPAKVRYSTAPPLKPSLWPWEGDGWRLSGWFRELESYRVSQNPAPDLVVGIVPPGSLNTYYTGNTAGLSMDGYKHVVLLDLNRTKTHHLLHEYMHTLGLPDNYGGTYPPPSAPGYTEQGHRIWNAPNQSSLYCAIMYDFAPVAWPTEAEYDTLISLLTEPLQIQSAPLQFEALEAGTESLESPRVMVISAVIEDSYYGSIITRRSPIFTDTGTVYAPQEVAPGHYEASGVRLLADGQEVAKAYRSNTMGLHDGSVDFGPILGTMTFALPWQAGIDTVEFCTFDSGGYLIEPMYDATVTFSANPPTAEWVDVPTAGSMLSGNVELIFRATDADPDSRLWAWVKVSVDDGQTWQPAGSYFALSSEQTTYTLDCARWPDSDACRIKLLVSDDGHTSTLTAGPYPLQGFDPRPAVECKLTEVNEMFEIGRPVIIPMTLANRGRAALEAQIDTAALPEWIRPETVSTVSILPDSQQTLFLVAEPNTPNSYITQINLATNDPLHPSLQIPVNLQSAAPMAAPKVCWAGTANGYPDGGAVPMPHSITIMARDRFGHEGLNAYVSIMRVSNGFEWIMDKALMESAGPAGLYAYTTELPESLAGQTLAFEFDFVDPATGLADEDGLRRREYDFTLEFTRPNSPPQFTSLDPMLEEYDYIYTGFGQSVDLSFTLDEPDGDPVYYLVHSHSSLPFELDAQAGTLHCVIPVLDDPYNNKVQNQTVELVAVDRFGAQTKASWLLYISPYNRINNRAYPYYSSTVLSEPVTQLQAFSFSALEGQYCRVEYRPVGSSTWTLIGQQTYDQEHPGIYYDGRMAVIPWNTSSLTPGAAYEVRFVDYWPGGSPDSSPPTVVFRKALTAGRVTQITAPSRVVAGQPFDLFVEVENQSAHTWTLSDGYKVVCPLGIDGLTGLEEILPAIDFAQVFPGSRVVFHARPTAASREGLHTMTWQAKSPAGLLGVPVSTQIEVVASMDSSMTGDINNDKAVDLADFAALSRLWLQTSQDPQWDPACDLYPDARIDLLDIAALTDFWLEQL